MEECIGNLPNRDKSSRVSRRRILKTVGAGTIFSGVPTASAYHEEDGLSFAYPGVGILSASPRGDYPDVLFRVHLEGGFSDPSIISESDFTVFEDCEERDISIQYINYEFDTVHIQYSTEIPRTGTGSLQVLFNNPEIGSGEVAAEVSPTGDDSIISDPDLCQKPAPSVPARFEELRDTKIALAGQIDDISQSITEQPRVEATLDDLERKIENGEVGSSEAISAVERMIQGEDPTELSLASLSPVSVSSPEDPTSKVGEPVDSPAADDSVDIAGEFVQKISLLGTALLFTLRGLRTLGSVLAGTGSRLQKAESYIDTAITTVFSAIPFVADRMKDGAVTLTDHLAGFVEDGIEEGSALYEATAETAESTLRDPITNGLMTELEAGIDSNLESFDEKLGSRNGSPEFRGTDSDAAEAAEAAREKIVKEIEVTEKKLRVADFAAGVGALMAVGGAATSATGVGAALSVLGAFFAISFEFLGAVSAGQGMFNVREHHNEGLEGVVAGGI